jgi:quercetin dioxygenase-like cupin family protein
MEEFSLTATAHRQLEQARTVSSGRSATTVYGGHGHTLRQTVLALTAGQCFQEHENLGEAGVNVLTGGVRLVADDRAWDGAAGELIIVPGSRHALEAMQDAAVLLTVAKHS